MPRRACGRRTENERMAKFIYKMQNILNIKMRLETQAKTEFAEAAARLLQEEDKMQKLIGRKKQYESELKAMSADRLDIAKIKRQNSSIKTMQEFMQQQALILRIAERNRDHAREKLNESMQERKIHEKLREKAFDEFKLEVSDEEKKEIDELVSFSYNNNGKEGQETD